MVTTTKLYEYDTALTYPEGQCIQPIIIPYVKDNVLHAVIGWYPLRGDFVNLATGARTHFNCTTIDVSRHAGILIEPPAIKGSTIVCRYVYFTPDTYHIKIMRVTYDLNNETVSAVDEGFDVAGEEPSFICYYSWVLGGKTFITSWRHVERNIIRFIDLKTGSMVNLDLQSWLGTAYCSLMTPKVVSKGRELEMHIGRYLASDIHRHININTGVGTDLIASGAGSPQGTVISPVRFTGLKLLPLTGDTVVNSSNKILWYDELWAKIGETSFTDITYPNPRGGAPICKLANGNFLLLMLTYAHDGSHNLYLKLYEISGTDYSVVTIHSLASWTDRHDKSCLTAWSEFWSPLQAPIVDVANKLIYVGVTMAKLGLEEIKQVGYKINISDQTIDEWNMFLWLVKSASPLKVQPAKFLEYPNVSKVDIGGY